MRDRIFRLHSFVSFYCCVGEDRATRAARRRRPGRAGEVARAIPAAPALHPSGKRYRHNSKRLLRVEGFSLPKTCYMG